VSECRSKANAEDQNFILSGNTCFAVPLHKPSRNEPGQNPCYGDAKCPDADVTCSLYTTRNGILIHSRLVTVGDYLCCNVGKSESH
jgi:hypothetical protein